MHDQSVYLITDSDEICIGQVGEIVHGEKRHWREEVHSISFAAAISDIVADMLCSTGEEASCRLFAIELR